MKRQLSISPLKNTIVWGDCKEWLPYVPSSCVDCIYIDPPFFTQKDYEVVWGNCYEKRSYTDRWKGGKEHYIAWMRERLIEAKRVLKPTGSIFLHCDYRANYRLRMLLDEIFGENRFINEIIWDYKKVSNSKANKLLRAHDTILFYSKTRQYSFNRLFEKTVSERKKQLIKQGYNTKNMNGKKYLYIYDPKKTECMSKDKFDYVININPNEGNAYTDVFKIDFLNSNSKENFGYKTQKPEALIKRILECGTKENDLVMDFFGGGGTTAKVAHDLKRRFISGDVSPVACRVMVERLKKAGCKSFETKQIPRTKEEWHLTDGHKFAETICEFMGWEVNPKKSGDGGIDGWAKNRAVAVQIKHHKQSVGRHHIQGFLGSLNGYEEGIFVGWNFSPNAWEYTHIAERDFGKKIQLIPAHQILGELVLTKEQRLKYQALYEKAIKASKYAPPPLELVS